MKSSSKLNSTAYSRYVEIVIKLFMTFLIKRTIREDHFIPWRKVGFLWKMGSNKLKMDSKFKISNNLNFKISNKMNFKIRKKMKFKIRKKMKFKILNHQNR